MSKDLVMVFYTHVETQRTSPVCPPSQLQVVWDWHWPLLLNRIICGEDQPFHSQ
jgi:hypothetical protein